MRQYVKYLILFIGLLETFIFTGNILGWTGLFYMLKKEEIYASLCHDDMPVNASSERWSVTTQSLYMSSLSPNDAEVNATIVVESTSKTSQNNCDAQNRLLNLAYTIGSFCLGASGSLWGFLLKKWGLRCTRLLINLLLTTGVILLSLTKKETSYLIFPSLILMCLSGVPLRLVNMQIADLFPKRRSTVITFYSGAFAASSSIFIFMKYVHDAGLPWEWACFILIVLSVLMFPVTLFLLPSYKIEEQTKGQSISSKSRSYGEVAGITPSVWGSYILVEDAGYFQSNLPHICSKDSDGMQHKSINGSVNSFVSTISGKSTQHLAIDTISKELPLRTSFTSCSFWVHQYWFCYLLLSTVIYAGTLPLWSSRSFDTEEEGVFFAELYGIFQVFGLFLSPVGGLFMDWSISRALKESDAETRRLRVLQSNFWPIAFTTLMGIVVQGSKYFDNGIAIWISIVFVTLLRTSLLSIGTAYLRITFPAEHFSRVLGVISTMSAFYTLLQFPLFIWETSSSASVLQVQIFETVCLLVTCIHPALLFVTPLQRYQVRREKKLMEKYLNQTKNCSE